MVLAVIHMILFQTGNVKNIRHFPVSCGVQPQSVGTNGFRDAKQPTNWLFKISGINICLLQHSMICIDDLEEPGVEKN
jgi:hypothetical protein